MDDDCNDLRELALLFMTRELTDDVFETVLSRRRNPNTKALKARLYSKFLI